MEFERAPRWAIDAITRLEQERDSLEEQLETAEQKALRLETEFSRIEGKTVASLNEANVRLKEQYEALSIALIQAVEFVHDYPLGTEDQHYEERREDVLGMPETGAAKARLGAALASFSEQLEAAHLRDKMRDDGERALLSEVEARDAYIKKLQEQLETLRDALADNERDARWIVGQHQRLRDDPTKEVALAIVERCVSFPASEPKEDA